MEATIVYVYIYIGIWGVDIGVILGSYRDNGK